jgi:hypothetical protein
VGLLADVFFNRAGFAGWFEPPAAKKSQIFQKKCILAVDGFARLDTLPARLKRDSQVAR